jgi:hypothetical protein
VVFWAVAGSRADDKPADEPSLRDDLKKLQGAWEPVKQPEKAGYVHLEFGKQAKDGKDYLVVTHAVSSGKMLDIGNAVVGFALKADGKQRVIVPAKKDQGVSTITYQFDGETLVVEEGDANVHHEVSLKGRWKRFAGEKLP